MTLASPGSRCRDERSFTDGDPEGQKWELTGQGGRCKSASGPHHLPEKNRSPTLCPGGGRHHPTRRPGPWDSDMATDSHRAALP